MSRTHKAQSLLPDVGKQALFLFRNRQIKQCPGAEMLSRPGTNRSANLAVLCATSGPGWSHRNVGTMPRAQGSVFCFFHDQKFIHRRPKHLAHTPALNALKALCGAPTSMGRGEIPVELQPAAVHLPVSFFLRKYTGRSGHDLMRPKDSCSFK